MKILRYGNTVIDQIIASLAYEMGNQTRRNLEELFPNTFEKSSTGQKKRIILVTLHRRENHGKNLRVICNGLMQLSVILLNIRIIFALHPNPIVQQPIIDLLGFKMILRLLRDQLLYPTNQKGNTTHVFLSAVKILHRLTAFSLKIAPAPQWTFIFSKIVSRVSNCLDGDTLLAY